MDVSDTSFVKSTTAANLSLMKSGSNDATLITITPPQTRGIATVKATNGAHCLVLDVSYSMDDEAKVVNDSGDRVTHGWSLLDIVKHAACTYVQSLGPSDYLCIVTYASEAKVAVNWRACDDTGKKALDAAIRALKTEGTTNLRDGIGVGLSAFTSLPAEVAANPQDYAMMLAVCTDGCPTNTYHPPGGARGYARHTDKLRNEVEETYGAAAVPSITAIGFGNSLDSTLLHSFSDAFLHIPDPGSVGPFMVNLIAATRATAKVDASSGAGGQSGGTVTANTARLIIEPASSIASVPGYTAIPWRNGSAVCVELGSLVYDSPCHVVVRTSATGGSEELSASLEVGGRDVCSSSSTRVLQAADKIESTLLAAQIDRTDVVVALQETHKKYVVGPEATNQQMHGRRSELHTVAERLADGPLKQTVTEQCLLAVEPEKLKTWGQHYVLTLGQMLRRQRRSNFRDLCLQEYGKDALGREGLFETLSNDSELCFATLTPPTPSLLNRSSTGSQQRATVTRMPDEFMRGGGCFGPDATVLRVAASGADGSSGADGAPVRTRVSAIRAGDLLVCEDGRLAPVRCVVLTECLGGKAQLTRLPNGTHITEWHPLRASVTSAQWHFPVMLGTQVVVSTSYVYNFVLAPGFPTILVDGLPCAALGHGLDAAVVAHPYWGAEAVINDLMGKPGWEDGRVVMPAHAVNA